MPERLYELMSERMPNSLITIVHSEGVGENSEQFMTRMSIFLGSTLVLASTLRTQS